MESLSSLKQKKRDLRVKPLIMLEVLLLHRVLKIQTDFQCYITPRKKNQLKNEVENLIHPVLMEPLFQRVKEDWLRIVIDQLMMIYQLLRIKPDKHHFWLNHQKAWLIITLLILQCQSARKTFQIKISLWITYRKECLKIRDF